MAFSFGSFNKARLFDVDNTNFVTHTTYDSDGNAKENNMYWNLKEMFKLNGPDKVYVIHGAYINDLRANNFSRSGQPNRAVTNESAAVAIDDRYVTIPSFQIPEVKDMLDNAAAIDMIRNGRAGFYIEEYENNYGSNYKAVWTDVAGDM